MGAKERAQFGISYKIYRHFVQSKYQEFNTILIIQTSSYPEHNREKINNINENTDSEFTTSFYLKNEQEPHTMAGSPT